MAGADGIKHAENTNAIGIGCALGHFEGRLDVGHGTKIVNLIGLNICNDGNQVGFIAEITVMKEQLCMDNRQGEQAIK